MPPSMTAKCMLPCARLCMAWGWIGRRNPRNCKKRYKYGCRHMTTPTQSGEQEMLYIPLKKLNGWLFSINAAKVRADLQETVERYQEECFLVLHDYWNRGEAVRAKVQAELDAWRNQETESFTRGSHAGRDLNLRKQEKHYIAAKIRQCEVNLLQPDLFQTS